MSARPAASAFPSLNPAERRAAWRRLATAGAAMATRLSDTCGRELLEPVGGFAHALARDGRVRFPMEHDAAGIALAETFRNIGRAILTAGTDERRAMLAPVLGAIANAIDQLLTEQATAAAATWQGRMGERPD
jgi:hypothetical protein